MNCANCNAVLPNGAVFCSNCGAKVQAAPSTEAAGMRTVSNIGTMVPTELLDRPTAQVLERGALFADRYVVERQLGSGGMGVVYVAKDRNTNEDIALKLLHPGLLSGQNAMKRLVAEGVTARQIRHPNIVAVYDIAQANGQPFLTMEYVKGGSLRGWLKNAMRSSQEVPVATAIGIVKAILAGLAEAHRMGVVHRDLKPENVLLLGEPFQSDYRLKILDFGIAKAMSATGPVTTVSAGALGTPLYMAPEQRTAADTVAPSADLYSVSVMLYELLMENPPHGLWEPPSKSRNNVPPAIDAVIERGLKTRARDRFQSADDYVAALDAAQKAPLGVGKEFTKSESDKAQDERQSTQTSDAGSKEQSTKIKAEPAQPPASEKAKTLVTVAFGGLLVANLLGFVSGMLGVLAAIAATLFAYIAHRQATGDLVEPNARAARNSAFVGIGAGVLGLFSRYSMIAEGTFDQSSQLGFVVVFGAIAIWLLVIQVSGFMRTVQGRQLPRSWWLLNSEGWPRRDSRNPAKRSV